MLNVYICDDEQSQREYILSCIMSQKDNICVKGTFANPNELLKNLRAQTNKDIGLYFLDIDLGCDIDGFQLASEIRKIDPRGFIVIITAHSEMLPKTFEYMIEPLKYVIKDSVSELREQIICSLNYALSKYEILKGSSSYGEIIDFSSGNRNCYLYGNDILYITMSFTPHTIEVATSNSILQLRHTLSYIESKLPDYFIQISRETVVNVRKVKSFDTTSNIITLENNLSFNCSRSKTKALLKALKNGASH